jgi:hypothetical protein
MSRPLDPARQILAGETYGDWTVEKVLPGYKVQARCKCGMVYVRSKYPLVKGKSLRCKTCEGKRRSGTHYESNH